MNKDYIVYEIPNITSLIWAELRQMWHFSAFSKLLTAVIGFKLNVKI